MNTQVTRTSETLGSRILLELARQKTAGCYFTYRQRQQLRSIDDRDELRRTLAKWGFAEVDTAGGAEEIVAAIGRSVTPVATTIIVLSLLDFVFFGAPSLLFYITKFVSKMWRS